MFEGDVLNPLSIAKESALLAGEFLSSDIQFNRKVCKEFEHDVKIAADIQSEKIILDHLMEKSNFSILSEEKGMIERGIKDYFWIVDPVDGSLNYTRQIPFYCVSIGLWHGEKPVLGVVYDFNRAELFSGIADNGAWLNEERIHVSATNTKQNAVLFRFSKAIRSISGYKRFVGCIQSYQG